MLLLAHTCLENNINHRGNDIHGDCREQPDDWKRESAEECVAVCKDTNGCEVFTWISPVSPWESGRRRCCLKHSVGVATNETGVVSGYKICGKKNGQHN